jgi:hypothetical protein
MNERIKQLAEQAGAVFEKTNGLNDCPQDSLVGDEIEKFAELIVQECAQVCLAQRDPANLNYKPSVKFAEAITQHFGVEE